MRPSIGVVTTNTSARITLTVPTNQLANPLLDHLVLSHKDAEASIPGDNPVAGEEDPGAGIEDFVALQKS